MRVSNLLKDLKSDFLFNFCIWDKREHERELKRYNLFNSIDYRVFNYDDASYYESPITIFIQLS